ncbi:glycosyltransferase family 4 protein [Patescibacteria group bacterium]|nr:glycosyltransferase family 4 protein [Patescibacteria group bacterium]
MKPKRSVIGVDARFYGEAGPGRYAKAIVEHLERVDKNNIYRVFLRDKGFSEYRPNNQNFQKIRANYKWYSWEEQTLFLALLLKEKLDLLYVPHFNIPVLYPGKIVTAIPDIIMHTYSTEKGTTLPKAYFRFKKVIYRLVVHWAVLRSKKVIVPSKAVVSDFMKVFRNITEDKYVLAYEGVDPVLLESNLKADAVLRKYNIGKPYLIYISSMYEHKNVPRLIEAYEMLMEDKSFEGQLVLVGKKDKFSEEIQRIVTNKKLDGKIIMPGMQNYVSDEELVLLRKEALGYVFPSLKEGFSLTPLEAQAVGLPCLISDIDVHREIYADSVQYFDPGDVPDIRDKMREFVNNKSLREELVIKGRKTVEKYDWENTAWITYSTFQKYLSTE